MAAGSYQLIWVAQGGTGTVTLASLPQTGATTGQAIVWNGTQWAPGTVSGGGGAAFPAAYQTYNGTNSHTCTTSENGTQYIQTGSGGSFTLTLGDQSSVSNYIAGMLNFASGGSTVTLSIPSGYNVYLPHSASPLNYLNTLTSNDPIASIQFVAAPLTNSYAIINMKGKWTTTGGTAYTYVNGMLTNSGAIPQADSAATANTYAVRDGSGNLTASTFNGALNGNASTASTASALSGTITPSQISQAGATTNQVLAWNGSAYAPATVASGGSGITQLTGDVTTPASSSGSTAATVAQVGGKTASAVASAVTAVAAATNANTASAIVQRDSSGNFSAGTITAALSGNASTATSATSLTGTITASQISQSSATTNQVLTWNGSAYAPATPAGPGINQLTGDVTTPASSTGSTAASVASVGGKTAAAVASAVTTVAAATNANTASALVQRDSSGNFSAGTITASLSGNATTATSANTASSASSLSGTITASQISQSSATTGQALIWSGSAYAPTTIPVMGASGTNHAPGFVPDPGSTAGTSRFLCENATWATPAGGGGGGITALTGDVTASGSGSVAATVASVGGSTAAAVNTATVAANSANTSGYNSYIAQRDSTAALYYCNGTYTLNGSSINASTNSSQITYIIASGTNTVTLPANPTGYSFLYRFLGTGGAITITQPSSGTFYYWGGSTTNSVNVVNLQTANYIECFGIPGTNNYMLTNIQGNWQSAGSPIGVYSALSYPSVSGYVLTANGNTGMAAFAAPSAGLSTFPASATVVNQVNNTTPTFTYTSADRGKLWHDQGHTVAHTYILPASPSIGDCYWACAFTQTNPLKIQNGNSTQQINISYTTSAVGTTHGVTYSSNGRSGNAVIGVCYTATNVWNWCGGTYPFDWAIY